MPKSIRNPKLVAYYQSIDVKQRSKTVKKIAHSTHVAESTVRHWVSLKNPVHRRYWVTINRIAKQKIFEV
jgi:hypothetical protein